MTGLIHKNYPGKPGKVSFHLRFFCFARLLSVPAQECFCRQVFRQLEQSSCADQSVTRKRRSAMLREAWAQTSFPPFTFSLFPFTF